MAEWLLALPLALPLAGAAACLLARRRPAAQRAIAVVISAALSGVAVALLAAVLASGPLDLAVGGWAPPLGIALRADLLGAIMLLVSAVLGLAVVVYALGDVPATHDAHGVWPLLLLLLLGVVGAFLTADLFNLYVWFEVMLIASFVLLALGGRRTQLGGALIYVVLTVLGSTLFLLAVGVTYGATGVLDFARLGPRLAELSAERPRLVLALQALLLASFGLKAAVFPLYFWLPASYHVPTPAVSALLAGLLTKVGVYAMIRTTVAIFPESAPVQAALVVVAAATMVAGVLGALAQIEIRRILSFHIVSQIGYMVAGLAVATGPAPARRFALAASIFYVVHHILVKANLFLIAGVVRRLHRSEALDGVRGLARSQPLLAAVFLVAALSLAGVPPLSGFWAKLMILQAGLAAEQYALVAVAALTGLVTLISMMKIWLEAFAGAPPRDAPRLPRRDAIVLLGPAVALALITVAIGLAPGWLFEVASRAADQLLAAAGGDAP
jgi:multicomponent Na+:H+ antiporter subunit D